MEKWLINKYKGVKSVSNKEYTHLTTIFYIGRDKTSLKFTVKIKFWYLKFKA